MASVGLNDVRVEAAFATVERERDLGPGSWQILRHKKPRATRRGAAGAARSGTLSILPSKFAPSTKDRQKKDR